MDELIIYRIDTLLDHIDLVLKDTEGLSINELEENLKLRDKLNIGFEYNDFFIPSLLDDKKAHKYVDQYEHLIALMKELKK